MSSVASALSAAVSAALKPEPDLVHVSAETAVAPGVRTVSPSPVSTTIQDTVTLSSFGSSTLKGSSVQSPVQDLSSTGANNNGRILPLQAHNPFGPLTKANAGARQKPNAQTPPPAARPTPQESLQQLDESLQRVGINPQSVSLIRRVQFLSLADDPLALEQYFQSPPPVAVQAPQAFETSSSHSISNKSAESASIGVSAEDFASSHGQLLNISG